MQSQLPSRASVERSAASAVALVLAAVTLLGAGATLGSIPAGTRLRFHLLAPVSSAKSRPGEAFQFILLDGVTVDGQTVLPEGAVGRGMVAVAGHAGTAGHEGDLTLQLESLRTRDGREILFEDQRFEVNGRNNKVASALLGFVPFAGLGAHFVRGAEISVDPGTPLQTVLERPARITAAPSEQEPLPAPAGAASAAPGASGAPR